MFVVVCSSVGVELRGVRHSSVQWCQGNQGVAAAASAFCWLSAAEIKEFPMLLLAAVSVTRLPDSAYLTCPRSVRLSKNSPAIHDRWIQLSKFYLSQALFRVETLFSSLLVLDELGKVLD